MRGLAAVRAAAALAVALVLAACDISALMPQEHVDFAKGVVMLVQNRDAEGLEAVAEPALWRQLTPDLRERMARAFPHDPVGGIDVASYRSSSGGSMTEVSIVLLYRYPQAMVQAAVTFRTAEDGFVLTALNVARAAAPEGPNAPSTTRDM